MAQQPAESASSIAQQHHPAEPQQSITGIADSYAPRIVSHQQNRPAPVGIIPRLIKTVAAMAPHVVHRHFATKGLPVGFSQPQTALIIHRGLRAGIVTHGKPLEHERKRHLRGMSPPVNIRRNRLAFTQMQRAAPAPHMRQKSTAQNNDPRRMKHDNRPPERASHQPAVNQAPGYAPHPQRHEPERTVHTLRHIRRIHHLFDHRCCCHDGNQHNQATQSRIFTESFHFPFTHFFIFTNLYPFPSFRTRVQTHCFHIRFMSEDLRQIALINATTASRSSALSWRNFSTVPRASLP